MQDGKNVILCIDDDDDILMFLQTVLEAEGYLVTTAPSGEDALKIFGDVSPDLVICDLMMEEVDAGTNFVKNIRAAGGTMPIFLLSSTGDDLTTMIDYSSLGLSGVFQKPIAREKLLTVLKAKLG
jgi:DNA-binding response OmpR family regulator